MTERSDTPETESSDAPGLLGLAVRRPVSVLSAVILVCLAGSLALTAIPIQLVPDISIPTLTVRTIWPGGSPQEVESEILEEQEEVLKSLSGLERMESNATLDSGRITLEMRIGTSVQEALVRTTNLLNQVPNYPDAAEQPLLDTSDDAGPPLAIITVTADDGRNPAPYRTWVEEQVQPRIERIPGVGSARLRGGRDRELRVAFDPTALASRGLQIQQVADALRAELRDIAGGDVTLGKRMLLVRTLLEPMEPSDLENVVLVHTADGGPVLVRDIAEVSYALRKPRGFVMSDDQTSLVFILTREAGFNVLDVTLDVRAEVERIQSEMMANRGLTIEVVDDQVDYIQGALDLVQQNLFVGGALAVLVLLVFLRSWRASLVVSVAIPVCTLGTALGMSLLGRTINVVSLAGMAFAVGMVVDNAIVVLENIDAHRDRHSEPRVAALFGTREVWGAVLASTATTMVVFAPVVAWQDEVGEVLRDVAVAISLAVFFSLLVSVLVIPSFAAAFLPKGGERLNFGQSWARRADRFRARVGRAVAWVVQKPWRSVTVVVGAMAGSAAIAIGLLPPMEYLPSGNRSFLFGLVVTPPGLSVEQTRSFAEDVQDRVVPRLHTPKDGVPGIERWFFAGGIDRSFTGMGLRLGDDVGAAKDWFRSVLQEIPGAFAVVNQASLFGRSLGGSRSIEVDIQGTDLRELISTGKELLGTFRREIPGVQVRPIPGLELGAPELSVLPDREQAAKVGLNGRSIGVAVDAFVDGTIIGEVGPSGETKVDVVLAAAEDIEAPDRLATTPLAAPGGVVPLGAVAEIREVLGPTQIRRVERRRTLTLALTPPDDLALESAIERLRGIVAEAEARGAIPFGVRIALEGAAGDLQRAKARLGWVLLLATVVSFLLMAALFEDFLAPVAVMASVPMAAAGGVLGLRAVDTFLGAQGFDLLTAVGFIILIGVVVNNAILVVDGAKLRLRGGSKLADAIDGAVRSRLRPIFMSALTSLAGLSPLVFFPGSGSELYRGVGSIVLGGLALSTVLTVVVVPALFSLLERLRGTA